jgi:Tol biopolymer transport system component
VRAIQDAYGDACLTSDFSERLSSRAAFFNRFDRVVLAVIGLLVAAIVVTVLLGDRVGVTLERVTPLATAHSTSPIIIQFSEAMNRDTVQPRLKIEPELPGEVSWSGATLIYRPAAAMKPGTTYTVTLDDGATSETGRVFLNEYQFSFEVLRPRVAYLYPADDVPQNIWIADPAAPESAQQVTFSPSGIYDFAVSPDGTKIAFAETNPVTQTNDIKLLDLETGGLTQLTNCVDASCTTPAWRPDGNLIAYERVEFNTGLDVGSSPSRIWLLDVASVITRPLFQDTQILGYGAQWSADGQRLALVDSASASILVYDFNDGSVAAVPSRAGTSGALSPDGQTLAYPEITSPQEGQAFRSFLRVVGLSTGSQIDLSVPDDPFEDSRAIWHPDGERLAVARRYIDERFTRGYQIFMVNPTDGTSEQLTDDPRYANQFFWFDPTGDQLVIQRFPELDENMQPNNLGRPEIWTLNIETKELIRVATNGYLPRWVP